MKVIRLKTDCSDNADDGYEVVEVQTDSLGQAVMEPEYVQEMNRRGIDWWVYVEEVS